MKGAIFLSASVPDPMRAPEYSATAEVPAITAAVSALLHVTLGRRPLIWGGHPAITPMVWTIAQQIGVDYSTWVCLYQSRFFQEDFPEENSRFGNVKCVDSVSSDREKSLQVLRQRMFSENRFDAAVFIGGMAGVVDEYLMIRAMQPAAKIVPVATTGGAALKIAQEVDLIPRSAMNSLDYVALFHEQLGISVREERFHTPNDQPTEVERRYWRRSSSA